MTVPDFIVALRRHIGHAELWLPGVTAVVRRRDERLLLVRRADNGEWSPVTGIVDPGEEPAVAARREVAEEAGVQVRVDRLASVQATPPVTYANGDRAIYLDHTFACTWVSGEPYPADGECSDVGWFAPDGLPAIRPDVLARIFSALSDDARTEFRC